MKVVHSFLIALILASSGCGQTPAPQPDRVDDFVQGEMQRQHIPGLSLLVARDGKVLLAKGYGFANVELQVPVKPETVFQSGSVGKQFTATAVMMLVEDGKIKLDDPITHYLTDAPATWKQVTIRELLSHTAGFGDYPKKFNFRKDYTEADELRIVEGIPLAFTPGTKWRYSNLGYVTLGILIHKVTGGFYSDFLQKRIAPRAESRDLDGQRSRYHPQPRGRLSAPQGAVKESGMGIAHGEHDCGRKPVFLDPRLG